MANTSHTAFTAIACEVSFLLQTRFAGCKENQLLCTSPNVISTSPKINFDEQDLLQFFSNLNFKNKINLPIG